MVNSNVTTITLDGNEIKIEFSESYPYYQITNKGDTDIYVSLSPNITPEAEGVYTVSAGGSEIIGGGYSFNAFYVLGTGKAYIRGKQNAMPASFKIARKGGGGSAENILPYSEGLTYYFDYQKNISDTSWTDIIQGYQIKSNMLYNNDYAAMMDDEIIFDWGITKSFTFYGVFKVDNRENTEKEPILILGLTNFSGKYVGLINNETDHLTFSLDSNWAETNFSTNNYIIAAITYFEGTISGYVNGKKLKQSVNNNTVFKEWLSQSATTKKEKVKNQFKAIAFYENVAQDSDIVLKNTQYIAQKYGIEI